ncbi:phosphoribosylglycinamide formyltransferase [Ectothiorhodospiraceae bacterium BW-2]|nr:phosphoribosylglycinamide formyltransferase [Ectothiorhodospiraceae bacterium BW-2]
MSRVVVLISGSGSNLQALIDRAAQADCGIELVAVISNRPQAYGLQRAAKAGIPTAILDHQDFNERELYDQALQQLIDSFCPDLVILAGFMRILTAKLVNHYLGRMVNIHPSLLPKYRGLNTHQRALEAGDSEAGCTVHFVTPALDAGPIIAQARVDIYQEDTPQSVAARVLAQEHQLFPQVVCWFAAGRLQLVDGVATLDGEPVSA